MAGTVDLQEFVVGFVVEAEEYLDSVNRNLVAVAEAIKQNRAEPRAVRELFRALHTIKGLASMVGAEPIVAIAHEMESILRTAERSGGYLSDANLDLLLKGTRALEERVRVTASAGISEIPPAPPALLEALALSRGGGRPKATSDNFDALIPEEILKTLSTSDREQAAQAIRSGRRVVLIDFQPSGERAERGFNITTVREQVARIGEIIKVVPRSCAGAPTGITFSLLLETGSDNATLSKVTSVEDEMIREILPSEPQTFISANSIDDTSLLLAAGEAPELEGRSNRLLENVVEWMPSDQSSLRVDIRRLDEALERLSELVVNRSRLTVAVQEITARGVDTRNLHAVLAENTRQLKRLRAAITKARMVPLAELLQRLPLVVRGLTKDSDKAVNLVLQVAGAEVDKAVADKIFPAIVHLVRNAVDHAIETKSERRSLGKPETATLTVRSDDTSGTNLVLTISDDGRGIAKERVAKKAGFVVARNDEELLQQITIPGLSTRDEVTTTSGRGMGMDIVKRTIDRLGGLLTLSTKDGVGTTFSMQVPVSVTIVDVLSFISGGQTLAVPVAMVDEIIELDLTSLVHSPSPKKFGPETKLLQRRGEAIPFISLEQILYQRSQPGLVSSKFSKALVVKQRRGDAIAFGIDRMIGQQEVVVRQLDDVLVRGRGMAGATDLGDGRPTLVVDLANLGSFIDQYFALNTGAPGPEKQKELA